MSYTVAELRQISDDDLIARHDKAAGNTSGGVNYYLEELRRRESRREGERLEHQTEAIRTLTVWITIFTAVNLIIAGAVLWQTWGG